MGTRHPVTRSVPLLGLLTSLLALLARWRHPTGTSQHGPAACDGALPAPVPLAGTSVHPVVRSTAADTVAGWAAEGRSALVVTPNVDHVVLLRRHAGLRSAYAASSLRLCDGLPLVLLARLCGRPVPERVTGADLFTDVCARAEQRGLSVFVAGGAANVLERGLAALRSRHPRLRLAGHSPPFGFEGTPAEQDLRRRISEAAPDIVMVCLGAPKAEVWATGQLVHHGAVYLCVGAAIDFAAGTRRRAPRLVQRLGLEWLYRLVQEPRRLWRRYLVQDSAFLGIALREVAASRLRRDRSPAGVTPPSSPDGP